ncbi:MAG: type IV secretion system DNA-binding domain-containing protein, partial [Pseudoruegeria sp.]
FDDVYDLASFTQIAEVMIPTNADSSGDQFWSQSARIVFEYVARQLYEHGPRTNEALKQAILNLPSDELSSLISSTPGAHFFHESIEKTSQSIRANLIAELRLLEFLRSDGPRFSIREWMKSDEPSFLFLTGDAEHAAATRNLTSVLLEVGANAMMSGPKSSDPTVFFFMDEVPTLNRLPFLVKSLAEIRQFGGAFVLGYQVYSQLEDIYGREAAQTINGTINNRIVFNTPDFRTAKIFSESLGSQDMLEKRANISVGAHEARDGVGFMQNRVERQIVMPAEIQSLPQFSAYIRFAYDAPTALVEFEPFDVEDVSPGFLTYLGDGFSGSSAVLAPPDEADAQSPKNQKPSKKLFEEFVVWAKQNMNAADGEWMKGKSSPPDNIAACWAFFAKQRHDGVQPDNIIPFVNTTSDMMDRRGGSGRDNTPVGAPHPAPWEMDQSPPGTMPSVSHDRQQHINSAKIDTKVRVSKPEPKPSSEIESAVVWISTDELGTF